MAAKYGNTWWGEQWLKSLSNIDFSNRLPRGRRYANNGSVDNNPLFNQINHLIFCPAIYPAFGFPANFNLLGVKQGV